MGASVRAWEGEGEGEGEGGKHKRASSKYDDVYVVW